MLPKLIMLAALVFLLPGAATAQLHPNAEVEAKVRAAFPSAPEMITVARCESGFRQFAADGSVLRGGAGRRYLGIFQIGEAHL